jgi:tetratricopeptide (TPR) repeat protein/DNA-binding winged helix-turn-helix (wHTH) protein/TolB-like protein
MNVLGNLLYRFEGVEVNPSQGSLSRNGEELVVRQKSLQLLVYLLEQRHRLVTKEELIERVWEGQAVTDDALVQLIGELRRSLGDNPREPRFIKTVHKGGYRFIAPVEEGCFEQPVVVEMELRESVEIEYEEEITGEADGRTDDALRRAEMIPGVAVSSSRRIALAAAAMILLAGLALATYQAIKPRRSQQQLADVTLPQFSGKRSVAVLYFDNQSASPDLDWLREGLADMLIAGLSRSEDLNVLSRRQLQTLLERIERTPGEKISLDDALLVGQKSHAEVIALGSFARLDGSIRIDVVLHDASTGQPVATERLVVDKPGDILTQVDLLSLKIASSLGASSNGQRAKQGLAEVMTDNLEAYRYYSLATGKALALENTEALELLGKAIELDPQFAMAHARIGYVYAMTWTMPEKARPYLEKAFQLSGRLTEKDRHSIAAWYEIANLDYLAAIATFRRIIALCPLEAEAYLRLAILLVGEDRFEESIEVAKQGLVIDPEAKDLYNVLGGLYSSLARHEEGILMHRRFVELAPDEPNSHDSLGLSYQWAGRYGEAIQAYTRALALKPDFEVALIHLANVHFQLGHYRDAIDNCQRYVAIAASDGDRARGLDCVVRVYWKKGNLDQAQRSAKNAARDTSEVLWSALQIAMERGDLSKAQRRIAEESFAKWSYSDRGTRGSRRAFYYLRGYFALKSGRPADAIKDFKEALTHRPAVWSIDPLEDCLASACLELGRWDEAIAEYQRVISINPNYPLAHYHLAQAFERRGEPDKARLAYEQFLEVWRDADSDVPEVTAARQWLSSQ